MIKFVPAPKVRVVAHSQVFLVVVAAVDDQVFATGMVDVAVAVDCQLFATGLVLVVVVDCQIFATGMVVVVVDLQMNACDLAAVIDWGLVLKVC